MPKIRRRFNLPRGQRGGTANSHVPRFYAFVQKIELLNERQFEVTLECTPADWFDDRCHLEAADFRQANPFVPVGLVRFTAELRERGGRGQRKLERTEYVAYATGFYLAFEESTWYELRLAGLFELMGGGVPAQECSYEKMQPSLQFEEPEQKFIVDMKFPPRGKTDELQGIFAVRPDRVGAQAAQVNAQVAFVGVQNIGQGGCSSIYGSDGRPFLYYDFGRARSRASRPLAMKPCLSGSPTVILSHWDGDHYELACDHHEALHVPWLVMEGLVGGGTGNIFNALTHKRVWPDRRFAFEEYNWGFVLRASFYGSGAGVRSNNNGLVVLLRVQDDSDAPPIGERRALDAGGRRPQIFPDERYILMTGDASCHNIPSCVGGELNGKIIGINAVHHGAYEPDMEGQEHHIPQAAPALNGFPPLVIYSAGIDRTSGYAAGGYNHPRPEAIGWYRRRGYHLALRTNVPTGANTAPFTAPRNRLFGWRLDGPAPGLVAAAAIQTAATQYETDAGALRVAFAQHRAVRSLLEAAYAARNASAATATTVRTAAQTAVAQPAYAAVANGATIGVVNPIVANLNLAANAGAAFDQVDALDDLMVTALDAAANQAEFSALALANASFAGGGFEGTVVAPKLVHCQPGYVAMLPAGAPGPHPVTDPPPPPKLVVATAAPAPFNTALAVVQRAPYAIVHHPGHGMPNNSAVTFNNVANVAAVLTFNGVTANMVLVDADTYEVPLSTNGRLRSAATISFGGAGTAHVNQPVTILDGGATPSSLVKHAHHGLTTGHLIDIAGVAGGPGGTFNGIGLAITKVDEDSYEIQRSHGVGGKYRGDASGTQRARDFVDRIHLDDTGGLTTTVTHPAHGLLANDWIEIAKTGSSLGGNMRRTTTVGVNSYTIAESAVANGVTLLTQTGRRGIGSEVAVRAHAYQVGDWVYLDHLHVRTPGGPTLPAYNGWHQVTSRWAHEFLIAATNGTTGNVFHSTLVTSVAIADQGAVSAVRHRSHGLSNGDLVTFVGTLTLGAVAVPGYDGVARVVTVVDNDHYTVPFGNGGVVVHRARISVLAFRSTTAEARRIAVTFHNERIEILDPGRKSTVTHANHQLATGDLISITNTVNTGGVGPFNIAPFNAVVNAPITVIDVNTYSVGAGAGGAGTYTAQVTGRGGRKADTPVTIDDPGDCIRVTQAAHGLVDGAQVSIGGGGPLAGGPDPIAVIDADHYFICIRRGGNFVGNVPVLGSRGAQSFANEPVQTLDDGVHTVVAHRNHGLPVGAAVTLANSALGGGPHNVTAVNDPTHYTLPVTRGLVPRPTAESRFQVNGAQGTSLSCVAGTMTLVTAAPHGLNVGAAVVLAGTYDGTYNSTFAVATVVSATSVTVETRPPHMTQSNVAVTATTTSGGVVAAPVAVAAWDDGVSTTINQVGHPFTGAPAEQVTIVGGAHAGVYVPAVVDASSYTVPHTTGNALAECGITVAGQAAIVAFAGGAALTVTQAGHNLVAGMKVTVAHSEDAAFDGDYVLTVTGVNTYTLALPPRPDRDETFAQVQAGGARATLTTVAAAGATPQIDPVEPPVPVARATDAAIQTSMNDHIAVLSATRQDSFGRASLAGLRHEVNPGTCGNNHSDFINLTRQP